MFGEQLTEKQKKELEEIMDEFADVLRGRPGQTHVAEHAIHTEARPIRQAIPQAYREEVMKELREMEENGHPIVNGLPLLSSLRGRKGACGSVWTSES